MLGSPEDLKAFQSAKPVASHRGVEIECLPYQTCIRLIS